MTAAAFPLTRASHGASVGDYFTLLKPRVMSLVVLTAIAGLFVAPGHLDPISAFTAILCIAVGAGASGALNMAFDSDIDAVMTRTRTRPIPMGRIGRESALAFGCVLAVGSVAVMGLFLNFLAAALLAFTIFFYVVVYTLLLKRRTPQNIVIGGLAGALPPAIGWAAASGMLDMRPLVLVAIIFVWTPPHFWALSLWRADDYARAGVPMLPVQKGKRATRRQMLVYALVLLPLGMAPAFIGMAGPVYLACSLALGLALYWQCVRVLLERDEAQEPAAHRLFVVSIVYVFALFASLIVEHVASIHPIGRLI